MIVIRGGCAVGGIQRYPAVVAAAIQTAFHGVVGCGGSVLLCFPLNAHAASISAAAGSNAGHLRLAGDAAHLLVAVERRVLCQHLQSIIIVGARVRDVFVCIIARNNAWAVDGLGVEVRPTRVVVHAALQHHIVCVAVVGIAKRL